MKTVQWLAAVATISAALPAFASPTPVVTSYDFNNGPVAGSTGYNPFTTSLGSTNIANDFGNSLVFKSTEQNNASNSTVTVQAFAGTGSGGKIENGVITQYTVSGGGSTGKSLGELSRNTSTSNTPYGTSNNEYSGCNAQGMNCVDQASSGDPEHAIDNTGAYETLMLSFNSKVMLNSLTIGFPGGSTPDSDATVLYYTGSGVPPTLIGAASYSSLLGAGWAVANGTSSNGLFNIGSNTNQTANLATPVPSAQYWLVGAYINGLTGQASPGDTNPDYLKLRGLSTSAVRVPEPGSLALFGIAGGALFAGRRRKAKAVRAV